MPGFHLFRLFGGGRGNEALNLDRPISNFDVAGVPTGAWSSSLFGCLSNLRPSCVLSFCLPCVMWSQVVVRAQIPCLIMMKNTFSCLRGTSGYRCFIDAFSWALAIGGAALVLLIVFHSRISPYVRTLLGVVAFAFLGALLYFNGHVRTAFKMKYRIREFPEGCGFWECAADAMVACVCFPCAISQMARHVFQYQRWDPEIGMFLGDPYHLLPLENDVRRPAEADEAGMLWTDNRPHPDGERGLGRNNRPPPPPPSDFPRAVPRPLPASQRGPPVATVISASEEPVTYNADGTIYKPAKS